MCQLTELVGAAWNIYQVHIEGHLWLNRKEHYDQLVMSVLGGRGGHTSMHAVYLPCVD